MSLMNLYLVRHGDAFPVGEQGVSTDEERPLSERGVEQIQLLGQALTRLNLVIDRIHTSPLLRARQTAEILARALQILPDKLLVCEELAPGSSPKKLAKYLLREEAENHLLIGHAPDISQQTAWLIGTKEAQVEFAKGGVAAVRSEGMPQKGGGTLLWLFAPKSLKALMFQPA
jgi:phosphohistidine phosphatase